MNRLLIGSALCASLSALAIPALAQEAEGDVGIGDIVVTAQKRAESIQDVPIAISAVSSEYLQSRGITSIDSLGSIAPNVKIERAPSNKTISQIAIRGSVTINPAVTWEPAVGLYLDGVYIAKAQGSIFDVADLERVEVLRGPQGTLYGRNALAGAVNLIPKKPSGKGGGSLELTYGNFNHRKAKAVLDLPAFGPVMVKVSGQWQKRDGFIKLTPNPFPAQAFLAGTPLTGRTNDLDNYSTMAQVRIEPTDAITLDYTFDYSKYNQRPDYAQLVKSADFPFVPLSLYATRKRQSTASLDAVPLQEKSRAYGHALTMAYDLGAATLKSITAYRNLKWDDALDLDGTPLDVAATGRHTKFHSWSQELQLTGSAVDDRLNYVVGAFYYKEKAETLGPQRFFGVYGPASASILQSDYGSHTKAWAVYAQADFRITDPLKLTLGARYTEEKKDIRREFAAGSPLVTLVNVAYGDVPKAKFTDFSPAVTLGYELSPDINVYGRWARGFKSGGFNGETDVTGLIGSNFSCSTPPGSTHELCNPYKPEKVDSYELGIKTKLLDNTLIFNVAGFWDDHKDIQLSVFTASGAAASVVRNAAQARIRGLEFEMVARPAEWFTVNGSVAYLDAKYKNYLDGGVDVAHNRAFPHTPKYTAAFGVDWRVVEGDWGKFNMIGDLNFVSKYFTYPYALVPSSATESNAYNTLSQGRTMVNLRAALSDLSIGGARAEIAAWVRNLTKESHAQNYIDFGAGFGGLTVGYFPDPRTYGVTVGFRF